MRAGDLRLMFAHKDWADARVLDAAGRLPMEAYRAPSDHSLGSLHDTLFHVLNGDVTWRIITERGATKWPDLDPGATPDYESLRRHWDDEGVARNAYLATLTDASAEEVIRYQLPGMDEPRARLRWQLLWHSLNHSTLHRAEVAHLLTRYGESPGELDVMWVLPKDVTA